MLLVVCMALASAATACRPPHHAEESAEEAATTAAPADVRQLHFAPQLDIDIDAMTATADGVYYRDVRQGSGRTAGPGDAVTVEYKAWLPDGTLFEQRPSPEGFGLSEFVLGVSAPVPGLNAAMSGMRVGGVRRVVVPGEQAYGLVGRPAGVPAQSPVLFEVRLVAVSATAS